MTTPNWIDPKITVGNIITLLVMIVGFFVWGVRLEAEVSTQTERIVKLEAADVKLTAQAESARDSGVARQEAVLTRLARIEAILERIDKGSGR